MEVIHGTNNVEESGRSKFLKFGSPSGEEVRFPIDTLPLLSLARRALGSLSTRFEMFNEPRHAAPDSHIDGTHPCFPPKSVPEGVIQVIDKQKTYSTLIQAVLTV